VRPRRQQQHRGAAAQRPPDEERLQQISSALYKLRAEANNPNRSLYANNQAVYGLLRYGVPVKLAAGKPTNTIHLVNWQAPEQNDFVIVEEVTLKGNHERRPNVVLYVNGIAVGVLELKNSRVSIGDGIGQNLSNQFPEFNAWFFSTKRRLNDGRGNAMPVAASIYDACEYFGLFQKTEFKGKCAVVDPQ
jgi:type I restriction enzyme R subunit